MKSLVFNRKSALMGMFLTAAIGLNAQIESTHTDEKYNYTTVVYKSKAASDKEVLSALDNSIGMGDVVRVTVAPPKPAAPVADKSKGEDIWLKPVKPVTLTASTAATPYVVQKSPAKTVMPASSSLSKAPAVSPVAAKPVTKPVAAPQKQVAAPAAPVVAQNTAPEVAPVAAEKVQVASTGAVKPEKSAKTAHKSVKKAAKKSRSAAGKFKNRSKGKQRYSCPRF